MKQISPSLKIRATKEETKKSDAINIKRDSKALDLPTSFVTWPEVTLKTLPSVAGFPMTAPPGSAPPRA